MALSNIAQRLFEIRTVKNVPLTTAFLYMAGENLAARFSGIYLLKTVLSSRKRVDAAEREMKDKGELNQIIEDQKFKEYATTSISRIASQLSILSSATKRNSELINVIASDLGYFKGQRRLNPLRERSVSAFRAPLRSNTVKGRIEKINEDIQTLKADLHREADVYMPGIKKPKESTKDNKDLIKTLKKYGIYGAAGVAGLGGLLAMGGKLGGKDLNAKSIKDVLENNKSIAAVTTVVTAKAIQKLLEVTPEIAAFTGRMVMNTIIPIAGQTFRGGFGYGFAKNEFNRLSEREKGVRTENPYQPGTEEYRNREYLNNLRDSASPFIGAAGAYTATRASQYFAGGAIKLGTLAVDVTKAVKGKIETKAKIKRMAELRNQIKEAKLTRAKFSQTASGKFGQLEVVDYKGEAAARKAVSAMDKEKEMRKAAAAMRREKAAADAAKKASSVTGKATRVITTIRSNPIIAKLSGWLGKLPKWMTAAAVAAAVYHVYRIKELHGAYISSQSSPDPAARMSYDDYKKEMKKRLGTMATQLGTGVMGSMIGAVVGTAVAPVIGTIGGAIAGFAGGTVAGVVGDYLQEDGALQSFMGDKLFGLLFEGEKIPTPPAITAAATPTMSQEDRTATYARTQAPEEITKKMESDASFMNEVGRVAAEFNIDSADLLSVMYRESKLNPQAVNKTSNATGLIQFMPETAKNLGTSVEQLKNMSATEQMKYVEAYFKSVDLPKTGLSRGQLYGYVFMPAKVKGGVLAVAGTEAYNQNKGLDVNRDGIIDVNDLDMATRMSERDIRRTQTMLAKTELGVSRLTGDSDYGSALTAFASMFGAMPNASVDKPPAAEETSTATVTKDTTARTDAQAAQILASTAISGNRRIAREVAAINSRASVNEEKHAFVANPTLSEYMA